MQRLGLNEMAAALGVTERTLRSYARDGCPHERGRGRGRGGPYQFDPGAVQQWMEDNGRPGAVGDQDHARLLQRAAVEQRARGHGAATAELPVATRRRGGRPSSDLATRKLQGQIAKLEADARRLRLANRLKARRLVLRQEVHSIMASVAARLREAGEILMRECGEEAHRILREALDDCERDIARLAGQDSGP